MVAHCMKLSPESVVHATLPPKAERLFLGYEPMTSMSQVSKQPYFWSEAHPRNKMPGRQKPTQ